MSLLGTLQTADAQALNAIRETYGAHTDVAIRFVHIASDIEVFAVTGFLVVWWLYGTFRQKTEPKIQALEIFWSIGAAFATYWVLNIGLPVRPRPETVTAIAPLISHLPDNSFPSWHAIFAGASIAGTFVAIGKKCLFPWLFLILGLIMCLSRVIAGVHYPGDILVGLALGWIIGTLSSKVYRRPELKKFLFDLPLSIAAKFKL